MRKIISLLLIIALLFSLGAGCKRKDPSNPSNSNATDNQGRPSDGESSAGNPDIKAPPRAPVGNWDIPIPEINPLGAQGSYAETSYQKGLHELKYIDNFVEYKQEIQGEIWQLMVEDTSATALLSLKAYAEEINADIFESQYDNRMTFCYTHEDGSLWWGDAISQENGYMLNVVKQAMVSAGKEVKFATSDSGDDEEGISFITRSDGKRFQSVKITIPDGNLNVSATDYLGTSMVKRTVYYRQDLFSHKSNTFVLDNIPQGKGILTWKLTWESGSRPSEIGFLLEEGFEIPPVTYGDELGALKVCGVPFGGVTVESAESVDIVYEDKYSTKPDMTPEGDLLFWLPAGYWNVVLDSDDAGLDETRARMIPVSSGEMTVVTMPQSMKSAFLTLNSYYSAPENITGSIRITEAVDQGETAKISMIIDDPKKRDVFPSKDNTTIMEGGQKAEITDIQRQIAPPSVVLVLDSSGSMSKDMDYTLKAAREFIAGLPDQSFIKVVDFDSAVRILDGETKDAVAANLSKIKAEGSTKLFDATLTGLELLEGKNRPALVVFADGADSSVDGQGVGSSSSREDVLEAIAEANIPLYTIAFGAKPDQAVLKEFAAASGGQSFSAKDETALKNVFAAINSKFGNSFVMTYKRPKEAGQADTPVVSMVIDASGSMDTDPAEEEGCGWRIDKVKNLFHDFVMDLPDQCLMQLISFQTGFLGGRIINMEQALTLDKANILQGIGEIQAEGGTPILDAIRIAYNNLNSVPSNNKVIVYLTDAALEVEEEEQKQFEELLTKIKESNITVLWAGMGVDDKEDVFKAAAGLSGGRYAISEDPKVLKNTLDEILSVIKSDRKAVDIPLSISISDSTASGESLNYAASLPVKFSPPAKSGKVIEPEYVKVSTGTPMKRYDEDVASLITGSGIPSIETIMTKRIPLDKSSANDAMQLTIREAFTFSKFNGLEPDDRQFLALQVEMKNTTKDGIQYLIPDMSGHFYVNINNEGMYPASEATWLTETPVSDPGGYEINVFPKKDIAGTMMFIIPDVPIEQMSLHFYDTVQGHIHIPLSGKMNPQLLELKQLPTVQPTKITDAFSMSITAYNDVPVLDIYKAPENTSFRVVEAGFDSKVQALLNIEPGERFWMKINTASGPLMTKMSEITAYTPFGFMNPRMLGAGSMNKVRMVYPIADVLSGADTAIFGDVETGSLNVPVQKGKAYGSAGGKTAVSGNGMKVRVNQLTTLSGVERYGSGWVVADVTFIDEKDRFGTLIPSDFFQLVREGYDPEPAVPAANDDSDDTDYSDDTEDYDTDESDDTDDSDDADDYDDADDFDSEDNGSENDDEGYNQGGTGLDNFGLSDGYSNEFVRFAEYSTSGLLYGAYEDFAVFDSAERRGFVLFTLPEDGYEWNLRSNYMENLNVRLTNEKFASPELLVDKFEMQNRDEDFDAQLEAAVNRAILHYEATKTANGETGYSKTIDLGQAEGKNNIPVPTIVFSGASRLKSVKTIDDALNTMKDLKCILSESSNNQYSPEAVLTQGWGTQWDLAYLAMRLIAKCGLVPKFRPVALTQSGKDKLSDICGMNAASVSMIPGISYFDKNRNHKIFVIPFMKDISELSGMVYLPSDTETLDDNVKNATIRVSVRVETDADSAAGLFGDIGDILGGGDGDGGYYDYIQLLSKNIPLTTLSNDAVEIGYMEAGTGKGKRYMALISTPDGAEPGTGVVDTGLAKIVGIRIEVEMNDTVQIHERTIAEGQSITKLAHTLGINLPDLTEKSAKDLEDAWKKEYQAAKDPSPFSVLKWYGRNILNRFIANQSTFDRDTARQLGITLGRVNKPRCIMVTSDMTAGDGKMRSTIDLMQATNQCHDAEEIAVAAYNIVSGLFVSSLEGSALTGENKLDYLELWSKAPADTSLMFIADDTELREKSLEIMKAAGNFPAHLIDRVENTQKVIITPDKPILYNGQYRWAWLEIDNQTYETISVFDTGERAGFASYTMSMMPQEKDGMRYMVGAVMGVDVAVWSVAAASLKLGDYKDILNEAMATTAAVGKALEKFMEGVDSILDKELELKKYGGDGPANLKIKLKWGFKLDFNLAQNIVGFKQGFDDGAGFYFARAMKDLNDDGEGGGGDDGGDDGGDGGDDGDGGD